jgi:hypothetical protein
MQIDATIKLVWLGVEAPEILCREIRQTRAAGVKLLQKCATQLAELQKKETNDGDTSGDPHGSGNDPPADPVFDL